uniref:GPALPP motifs-containing protein 1 n=1 Tax=Eptatretus burgeri TaxID=7764 RepID=A0A8C4N314_EPTBU
MTFNLFHLLSATRGILFFTAMLSGKTSPMINQCNHLVGKMIPVLMQAKFCTVCTSNHSTARFLRCDAKPTCCLSVCRCRDGDTFGPALPPGFKFPHQEDESKDVERLCLQGENENEDDCDEIIGPMPATVPCPANIGQEVEERARRMKEKLQGGGTTASSREAWMIELPPERTGFSMGARTFRRRAAEEVGDRSVWTDTPWTLHIKLRSAEHGTKNANRSTHEDVKEERKRPSEEELKNAAMISHYNATHRSTSLMELHSRAAKRRAVDDLGTTPTRRPFDRDHDLTQPRSTAKDRRELLKKSMQLDSRFSHSHGSMFL